MTTRDCVLSVDYASTPGRARRDSVQAQLHKLLSKRPVSGLSFKGLIIVLSPTVQFWDFRLSYYCMLYPYMEGVCAVAFLPSATQGPSWGYSKSHFSVFPLQNWALLGQKLTNGSRNEVEIPLSWGRGFRDSRHSLFHKLLSERPLLGIRFED